METTVHYDYTDPVNAKEVAFFGCSSFEAKEEYSDTTFFGLSSPSTETSRAYGSPSAAAFLEAGGGEQGKDAAQRALSASPLKIDQGSTVQSAQPVPQPAEDNGGDMIVE